MAAVILPEPAGAAVPRDRAPTPPAGVIRAGMARIADAGKRKGAAAEADPTGVEAELRDTLAGASARQTGA